MRGRHMFAEDIPLLNTPNLVALVLRAAEEGGASAETCADRLESLFRRTGETPAMGRDGLVARCGRTIGWLREAGLLEAAACEAGPLGAGPEGAGERWVLTARGREALAAHPQGMDLADLASYPEFAAYLERRARGERPERRSGGYDEGFEAHRAGKAFTDNPHGFGSADHLGWENGWCEALDEAEGPGISPLTGGQRDAN